MTQHGYLRHPTLHGDTIVFVCDDDLWRVGRARRRRAATDRRAVGAVDALPVARRPMARLRRPRRTASRGLPDAGRRRPGAAADLARPRRDRARLDARGAHPVRHHLRPAVLPQLPRASRSIRPAACRSCCRCGQVNHLAFGPGKARSVIGRNTADPARWKRYRGGTAGHLWIDADGSGSFRRMTRARGQHHEPDVARRARLLPVRRRRRRQSLLVPARRRDLRRHTDHDDFYARHAQTDGQRIVYQCGADLWLFDPATRRTTRVDIDVPSHRTQAARKFVPAADHLGACHLHPAGHSARRRRARQAASLPALGRRGAAARRRRRRALPPRPVAGRRRDPRRRQRRVGRGTRRGVAENGGARTLPWDIGRVDRAARRAARPAGRDRQPPQRGADRRPRERRARPWSTAATPAAARTSPGRPTARGSPTPSGRARATARSSCTTSPAGRARSSRSPSSATTARRSTRTGATCTSCRSAPSTRSTTACSSS